MIYIWPSQLRGKYSYRLILFLLYFKVFYGSFQICMCFGQNNCFIQGNENCQWKLSPFLHRRGGILWLTADPLQSHVLFLNWHATNVTSQSLKFLFVFEIQNIKFCEKWFFYFSQNLLLKGKIKVCCFLRLFLKFSNYSDIAFLVELIWRIFWIFSVQIFSFISFSPFKKFWKNYFRRNL